MLYVHRSNRTERLLEALVEVVSEPLPDPFCSEIVVVQGRGLERWLSIELARRLGDWANPSFPFPKAFLGEVLRLARGEEAYRAAEALEPGNLLWTIARILGSSLVEYPEFEPVRAYLSGDAGAVRRLELSRKIAEVFDRYVLYRPEWLSAFERGENGGAPPWQAVLWREIVGGMPPAARAGVRLSELGRLLRDPSIELNGLPPRVSVFGISTLAPATLEALVALATRIDLHLFVFAPTREYLGSSLSPRDETRLFRHAARATDLHLDRGNPLAALLGTLAREFQDLLEEATDGGYLEPDDLFVDPAPDPSTASVLHVVQSDILNLRDRRFWGSAEPLARDPVDGSIEIHACHSPLREVEVLHDRLLALFEDPSFDPPLKPHEVAVLCPAIDDYAPYIEAVFGADPARPKIPFHLADRAPRAADPTIDAFFHALEVLRGRLAAPEVFDLLAREPVRRRFGIESADLEALRAWLEDTNVRWGADECHRASRGQPPIRENTWEFALDRLFLGFALPGESLFAGVLPVERVGSAQAELLGRFAEFWRALRRFADLAEVLRSVPGWAGTLGEMLEALFAEDLGPDSHRRIRCALGELASRAASSGFEEEVSLDALLPLLDSEIGQGAPARGFLSHGVAFCAMVPMRSIPFRVVALLGLSDGAFPRVERVPSFDATARARRPGDRTQRDDDRFLFLEALLSARQRLIVTFRGQSLQDNAPLPPSVVVSELLDAIADSFAGPAADPMVRFAEREQRLSRLVLRHPLHAFSRRYFGADPDPRLFSYSASAFEAARAERTTGERAFVCRRLDDPERPKSVSLEELKSLFSHPARWFCRTRLGLDLEPRRPFLDHREPLEVSNRERWQIGETVLQRLLLGEDPSEILLRLRASGLLPPGTLGQALFEAILGDASRIANLVRSSAAALVFEPVEVDLGVGDFRVVGSLRVVPDRGLVGFGYRRLGAPSELRLWLDHLVLQLLATDGAPRREALLFGRPETTDGPAGVRIRPVERAREFLEELLVLWREARAEPLPFFPRASRAFAQTLAERGADPDAAQRALERARQVFSPSPHRSAGPSESEDPFVRRLFGTAAPGELPFSTDTFARLARRVFEPLLAHREEIR
jgi:exodeoxyribonuclease V gamma subunit